MRRSALWWLGAALLLALLIAPLFAVNLVSAAPLACGGAPAPRLSPGMNARPAQVYSSLRAGLDSNNVLKILYRANGDVFTVLEGPKCGTGPYNWYRVDYKGTAGWVTEGTGSTYWVEPVIPPTPLATVTPAPTVTPGPSPTPRPTTIPSTVVPPTTPAPHVGACPGAPAPRLVIGKSARPAQVYSSLRDKLDSATVLKILYRANGDTFTVVNGPFCGTGPHNWWQVNYKGTIGWVTEGEGSTYWVEPIP